ncbi:PrgH/EprH family type III secretion apparatus protein [Burkholderia contaminans]|uniref:PrgH/EprH family type III secretion apparatus protein n=1 Tax=Burkholderia contaminans TaxID=488447 RepID=UPI001453FB9E|nr:PrgH/EprH family type III secretion apparatus protein [Burkholderia contaminans]VWC74739.1 type III secretion system protein BsaM [Burkholderia contaminans]
MAESVELPLERQAPDSAEGAVLRILSGSLHGCEYRIQAGATLFVVKPEQALMSGEIAPDLPDNAIVIPGDETAENFEVVLGNPDGETFVVRRLGADGVDEATYPYRALCEVGTLMLSVRRPDEEWVNPLAQAPGNGAQPVAERQFRSWGKVAGAAAAVILGAVAAMIVLTRMDESVPPVPDIETAIGGTASEYEVLTADTQNVAYVFARTQRDVARAKQALMRSGLAGNVEVVGQRDEEIRAHRRLLESDPGAAIHRVRLDDPARPVLVLSDERASRDKQVADRWRALLQSWLPYAKAVEIERVSDALVEQRAAAGIGASGATYRRIATESGVVFKIGGELDDVVRAKLGRFVDEFERTFGVHYVSFVTESGTEWLKGKSFKYGGVGYVKENGQHWYFENDLF